MDSALIQNLAIIKQRSLIIFPIIFVVGFLIYFLKDKFIGIAILIGGILGLIFFIVYFIKIKKGQQEGANKLSSITDIVIGLIFLLIGSIFVILPNDDLTDLIIFGYGDVALGIRYLRNYFLWITKGMSVILFIFYVGILDNLQNIISNFKVPTLIFGIFIKYPFTLFLTALFLIFNVLVLIGIYRKKGWKLILMYQGFSFINSLIVVIWTLTTPISESIPKFGVDLGDISIQSIESYQNIAKAITAIPMFIGLIISLAIWIYVYKKKEYFSNDSLE